MNRDEALNFIKTHSRLVTSMVANPVAKEDRWDTYEPIYFEQRLSSNGTPFVLQDAGSKGWDIYFISGGNDIKDTMDKFAQLCSVPIVIEK